jgi:kynureninase
LQTWATKAVLGHFTSHKDEYMPRFLDVDDAASKLMAPVVGALPSEVAVMDTLTTNLHLLLASFYRPTKEKYKIILEGKAFPSDYVCKSDAPFKSAAIIKIMLLSSLQWSLRSDIMA